MSKLIVIKAFVVGAVFIDLFIWRVQAQTSDITWRHPPTTGEPIVSHDSGASSLLESPLPDGMSLRELGELLKGLATQNTSVMRGAQDIAVFRQASPAVVLLKTKEGSGSGVILQNGLVLTNRHVVEGIGAVQIFLSPTVQFNRGK